jgi:hypothetical protein
MIFVKASLHTSLRGITYLVPKLLLGNAWDANPNFDFYFSDLSSDEIKSSSVSVVKQVLSKKINEANYTVVLVYQRYLCSVNKDY